MLYSLAAAAAVLWLFNKRVKHKSTGTNSYTTYLNLLWVVEIFHSCAQKIKPSALHKIMTSCQLSSGKLVAKKKPLVRVKSRE